jgi:hypothetical protein
MVKMWAEKEFRNLNRLQAAGIASPKPVLLRQHVLVMTFIGYSGGIAAPRLKVLALLSKMPRTLPFSYCSWQLCFEARNSFCLLLCWNPTVDVNGRQ